MEFDLDASRMNFDKWDFSVKVGGKSHRVREITVEEFTQILAKAPTPMSDDETQLLVGLFPETKKAEILKWDRTTRDEVTTAISAYLQGFLEKKRQRISAMITAGIRANPST